MKPTRFLLLFLLSVTFLTGAANHASAFYNPGTGRWLSKDPIGEQGGVNLYEFCRNNAIAFFDTDGRMVYPNGICTSGGNSVIDPSNPGYGGSPSTSSSPMGYSPIGWYAILNCNSIKTYEEYTLQAKAKYIAKKCEKTSTDAPGLAEFHESVWNLNNGLYYMITTIPGGLEVGQIFASVDKHKVYVDGTGSKFKATADYTIKAHDVFSFPVDGHNDLLHYLGGGLLTPIPRQESRTKSWKYEFDTK